MTLRERPAVPRPVRGALSSPADPGPAAPTRACPERGARIPGRRSKGSGRAEAPSRTARGNMLVIAMILLAVLSVLGVSAVTLSSEERRNAAAKARRDALQSCARAAQARIWAEVAKYGPTYLRSGTLVAAPDALPGGVTARAPAHYSPGDPSSPEDESAVAVDSVVVQFDQGVSDGSLATASDLTNRAVAIDQIGSGKAYRVVGRCRDAKGRELEAEFSMRFTLF